MGRLGERFAALRERDERALIPFVTAGDPDLATTEALLRALAEAGADAIELGRRELLAAKPIYVLRLQPHDRDVLRDDALRDRDHT